MQAREAAQHLGTVLLADDDRLFAFLCTDEAGRYAFTSVRPGSALPRIDCEVSAPGHAPRRLELAVALAPDGAGTLRGTCDLTLP